MNWRTDAMTLLEDRSVVQIPRWKEMAWLRHGFSTRSGGVSTVYRGKDIDNHAGDLNTGWTAADDPANVAENRRRLITALEGDGATLVTVRQVHSVRSLVVPKDVSGFFNDQGRAALEADGLMTKVPGLLLGIETADCVPVLVADVRLRVVAGFHAGWRGTVAGIVERGILQMSTEYGSKPEDMVAAVGPSIGVCCYSVGDEVREAFGNRFDYVRELFESRGDRLFLNLWEANRRQLIETGVPEERISVVGECSGCSGLPGSRKYFSHRCENGFTGRMMSVIGTFGD